MWRTILSDLIAGGIGALVGAFVAFKLERVARRDDQQAADIEAGYRALLVLGQMRDQARSFAATVLDPYRGSPKAWIEMKPVYTFPLFEHRLELGSLAFLMTTGMAADAQALQDAIVAEREFFDLRTAILNWNADRQEAMQRLSAEHERGRVYSDADLEVIFGIALKRSLEQSAAALPGRSDRNIERLRSALRDLHSALSRNLPTHSFQFPNESNEIE